jgi:hypothetical protein
MGGVWRRKGQEMNLTGYHDYLMLQARSQGAEIEDGDGNLAVEFATNPGGKGNAEGSASAPPGSRLVRELGPARRTGIHRPGRPVRASRADTLAFHRWMTSSIDPLY